MSREGWSRRVFGGTAAGTTVGWTTPVVCAILCCVGQTSTLTHAATAVTFRGNLEAPPIAFAAAEIRQAADAAREAAPLTVEFALDATGLKPQGYRVDGADRKMRVTGGDATGAMYGGLDVAEALRLGTLAEFKGEVHAPYIARRGIKFNLPLDARTPSYSDAGDAAQQNIPEMWSMDFWREFLDEMARDRFNVLTLWNLHPFPSLVKVPEYPEVALADVMRTTVKFDSSYSTAGRDMVRPSHLAHLETLKKMTIEEKVEFWRQVMQYAHDRGIEVYLFTWNVFVWGAEGKHGITADPSNPTTIDYFRRSVRETLLTYPLLAGFGITAGENMRSLQGGPAKEQWLWQTYGAGIRDVKKLQPQRSIRLIHRLHQTGLGPILDNWKDYPDTFDFSYKYSVAHMYSLPVPVFAKETLAGLPAHLRTWLTVRNDDIYSFRWGDPEYARAYVRGMPGPDKLAGYYMGPDGYIWGREFLSTQPDTPRQLVIKKQWYSFMLWGRLSYDPQLPNAFFQRTLATRFPAAPAEKLFAACAAASKIIPQITRFFWGDIDLKWFPEACLSHPAPQGFRTVRHFMTGETMPGSGIMNIASFRARLLEGKPMDGITPPQVARALQDYAQTTLGLVAELPAAGADKELLLTVGDLQAMAHLGDYYAEKILGATELALFDQTGKPEQQAAAVQHLESALGHWKKYAAVATRQYRPQLLTRIGYVDLHQLTGKVEEDIALARGWPKGTARGAQ